MAVGSPVPHRPQVTLDLAFIAKLRALHSIIEMCLGAALQLALRNLHVVVVDTTVRGHSLASSLCRLSGDPS